jgi:hypothetical protein
VGLGWEVKRHPVPPDNYFYRLFGKNATTGIQYLLPGTRIERVLGEKYWAVSVATIAATTDEETVVHQAFYWNFPYLTPIRGVHLRAPAARGPGCAGPVHVDGRRGCTDPLVPEPAPGVALCGGGGDSV